MSTSSSPLVEPVDDQHNDYVATVPGPLPTDEHGDKLLEPLPPPAYESPDSTLGYGNEYHSATVGVGVTTEASSTIVSEAMHPRHDNDNHCGLRRRPSELKRPLSTSALYSSATRTPVRNKTRPISNSDLSLLCDSIAQHSRGSLDNQRVDITPEWRATSNNARLHSALDRAPRRFPGQDYVSRAVQRQDDFEQLADVIQRSSAPWTLNNMQRHPAPSPQRRSELVMVDLIARSQRHRMTDQDAEPAQNRMFTEVDRLLDRMYPRSENLYDSQRSTSSPRRPHSPALRTRMTSSAAASVGQPRAPTNSGPESPL